MILIDPKICKECGIEFEKRDAGYLSLCSSKCAEIRRKKVQAENRLRRKLRLSDTSIDNSKWSVNDTFNRYRRGALRRNLVFELTKEDFELNYQSNCYYCGDKLKGIGFDRMDNKNGYIKSNIVPCCIGCNFMKHRQNKDEFIARCKKISEHLAL